jgi:hypothetical protein
VRSELRLSTVTLIVFVASNAVAHATKYNFDGTPMAEPTTMESITSWVSSYDILAILIAFMLSGMPMGVFWPLAIVTLCWGWKFAICYSFFYYLLQFLMCGQNDVYE